MSFSETEKLLKASVEGDAKSVQSLLAIKGIDINWQDILIKTFIKFKIYFFHDIQIFSFLEFNRIFNWTPLMYAAYKGCTEIVQLLLSKPNIEINCKSILI
ncbi:hypothetical protein M9Y10_039898 [Tritrichomonas musculus]|uniref:Ankyrin repeat protein n=1 Tax=Tritrichomonas musculus TaxID=1915356 RepID=A0ABR2GQQ1_9EUKA